MTPQPPQPAPAPRLTDMKWRVGRSVGRTIYAQLGVRASKADLLIGVMDTPTLARSVVEKHNFVLAIFPPKPGASLADEAVEKE